MRKKKLIISVLSSVLILSACTVPKKEEPHKLTKSSSQHSQKQSTGVYDIAIATDFSTQPEKKYNLVINETDFELNGQTFKRWMYTNEESDPFDAGLPLIFSKGQQATIFVTNNTSEDTNVHWHGLSLPNDQDGPSSLIKANGGTHTYTFTHDYSETYWYHSHNRPVRDQVDNGMYGPIIILDENDKKYSQDKILMLDDWVVNDETGHMQIEGDTDTVNGLTGKAIEPIEISNTDKTKLRLIQASTAKSTTLSFPFDVLITHTDGQPLAEPVYTNQLTLAPGERYDVELMINQSTDETFYIKNERDQGLSIPINYHYEKTSAEIPTFSETGLSYKNIETGTKDLTQPDVLIEMDSDMGKNGHSWTINGEVFPDTESFDLDKGKPYVIRFKNLNHMSNHPMHIHGAHFKVLSQNDEMLSKEVWKDTIDVPKKSYVDVLIQFDRAGVWMLHCHILDHEDGGMMTTINVK